MGSTAELSRVVRLSVAILLLAGGGIACQEDRQPDAANMDTSFQKEGELEFIQSNDSTITTIDIEIADTPQSRKRGLMYRRSLDMNQGMLFIFPEASTSGFWMKNTYIPLDIIFVGPDSQVVSIARQTRIMSEETIQPEGSKQFVVEVPAGFTRHHNITKSTRIRWERTAPADRSFLQKIQDGIKSVVGG